VLMENNISRIRKATEYWVIMAEEAQQNISERWTECKKSWIKINWEMNDINLQNFGSPEDFSNLHDIVKRHVEHESTWEVEIVQVASMTLSHVQKFMEHPIKARAILHRLSTKMIRYRERTIEIKETLSAPMDQHRFSYANTCEDLFIK